MQKIFRKEEKVERGHVMYECGASLERGKGRC